MLNASQLPPLPNQIYSIGYCCQLLQVVPGQLALLMEETGVLPSHTIDNVAYFDGDGVQVLVNKVNQIRKEISEAMDKLENSPNN